MTAVRRSTRIRTKSQVIEEDYDDEQNTSAQHVESDKITAKTQHEEEEEQDTGESEESSSEDDYEDQDDDDYVDTATAKRKSRKRKPKSASNTSSKRQKKNLLLPRSRRYLMRLLITALKRSGSILRNCEGFPTYRIV